MDITNSSLKKSKIILFGIFGNFFEFYDFVLFGIFAIPISKAFFPGNEIPALLNSLIVFSIAFFARPFGSIFFGYLGDNIGRKYSLQLSIIIMAISTFLIGCLPTYQSFGLATIIMLIILRLLQGFSLGGESNGSFIFLFEHLKKYNGLVGALILACGSLGMVVANLLGIIFTKPGMPDWAWRISFWLSLLIGIINYAIRSSLEESNHFIKLKTSNLENNFFKNMKQNFKSILITICIGGINSVYVYTLIIFIKVYLTMFQNYDLSLALTYTYFGLAACLFTVPLMGWLSDKFTPKKIMVLSCYMSIIFAFLFPYFLEKNYITLALIFLALIIGSFNGPTPAMLNSIFPTLVKYTGISFGFSTGAAIFGSLSPLLFVSLSIKLNSIYAITPYFLLLAFIGLKILTIHHNNVKKFAVCHN